MPPRPWWNPARVRVSRPLLVAAVGLAGFALVLGALAVRGSRAGDRFDLVRWEIETAPNRWLAAAGDLVRADPTDQQDDNAIIDYFTLSADDPGRARLENRVESIVEGRIDAVLEGLGLSARVSLPGTVFPPVDIELAIAPRVLVVSPRDVVRRDRADLLRPDITTPQALTIEGDVEAAHPDQSALVVGSGGVATYPAVVSDRTTYAGVLSTAAHEWTHHYLSFYPLGFHYAGSGDLRTINETVADLVGEEVARLVLARWGDPTQPPPAAATPTPSATAAPTSTPAPAIDATTALRDLRLEVDALLEQGRVEDAERRMEEVRQQLEDAGIYIRRINQAFFAWYGTYAARPEATDPLGGYLREIRERDGSLPAFLATVRDLGSRQDVVDALVALGGKPE